jgi:hypothetical protein
MNINLTKESVSPFLGIFNQVQSTSCVNSLVSESPNVQGLVEKKKLCMCWTFVTPYHLNVQIVLSSETMLLLEFEKSRCEVWLSHEFLEFPAFRVFSLLLAWNANIDRPNSSRSHHLKWQKKKLTITTKELQKSWLAWCKQTVNFLFLSFVESFS